MDFGIADLSIIPVRSEPSERSEMVTQILFGEQYEILEEIEKWAYVRLLYDDYCGWIDAKMVTMVEEAFVNGMDTKDAAMASETFNIISRTNTWGNKLIVPGSDLPYFDKSDKSFMIGDSDYSLNGAYTELPGDKGIRESVIDCALKFFNAPYLWGGRTPYGIDCSGLTQIVYKLNGIKLKRDAGQQVIGGDTLSFVEEALPGDLAFFGDEDGLITHVGIIWKHHKIIHASGRVRIDNVDHQGIYNEELKRYTHSLRTIKRIIRE